MEFSPPVSPIFLRSDTVDAWLTRNHEMPISWRSFPVPPSASINFTGSMSHAYLRGPSNRWGTYLIPSSSIRRKLTNNLTDVAVVKSAISPFSARSDHRSFCLCCLRIFTRSALFLRGELPKIFEKLWMMRIQGFLLITLFGFSALLSVAETSINKLGPWKVGELAQRERDRKGVFSELRKNFKRFLTTILICNIIVNEMANRTFLTMASAVFGEAMQLPSTIILIVMMLLLTEVTPKILAIESPIEAAKAVVGPLAFISKPLRPAARAFILLSNAIMKILGVKAVSEPIVTRKEIIELLHCGSEWHGSEALFWQDIIHNMSSLREKHVKEVMTCLADVVAIDANATLHELLDLTEIHQWSRVPVFEGHIKNIVGVAFPTDVLELLSEEKQQMDAPVRGITRVADHLVHYSMPVQNLLNEFRLGKHMALVVDENEEVVGVVTLDDCLKQIFGKLSDEKYAKA